MKVSYVTEYEYTVVRANEEGVAIEITNETLGTDSLIFLTWNDIADIAAMAEEVPGLKVEWDSETMHDRRMDRDS